MDEPAVNIASDKEAGLKDQKQHKRVFSRDTKEAVSGYLFALPAIVGFLALTAGPMVASLYYSFTKYSVVDKPVWVGLNNYKAVFTDPLIFFWKSFGVTIYYAFGNIITSLIVSFIIALLLNRDFKGRNALRAIFFLPSVLPTVANIILWGWMLHPDFGLINNALRALHLPTSNWLNSESSAIPALLLMGLWTIGGTMVIFLASLQDVPTELLEAVRIDGGNAWHRFKSVVFPFMSPVIFFQFIIGVVGSLQAYAQSAVLSQDGAPNHATYFMNVLIYKDAFKNFMLGRAAAESWIMFVLMMIITGVIFYTQRFWVYYQGGDKNAE